MNGYSIFEFIVDNYLMLLSLMAIILLFLNIRALRKESHPKELIHKTSKNSFDFIRKEMKVIGKQGLVFAGGGSVEVKMLSKQGDCKIVFPEQVYKKIFKKQRMKSKVLAAIFSTIPCNEDAYVTKNSHYIVIDRYILRDPETMVVEDAHTEKHLGLDKAKRLLTFTMISSHKWLICGLFFIMFASIALTVFGLEPQNILWMSLFCKGYFTVLGLALLLWISAFVVMFFI